MRRKNKDVGFNVGNQSKSKKRAVNKNEYQNTLFSREALLRQTNENMRKAEARTNENPLRTKHSYRLDDNEDESENEDDIENEDN